LYFDDEDKGLMVRVTEAGAKSFVLNYRTKSGRKRRYTIGKFPEWSTSAARKKALELRTRIAVEDFDPADALKADREAPTVADLCKRFVDNHLPKLRESSQRDCLSGIERDVLPAMGQLRVADVTFADCDALHRKITKRGARYSANRCASMLHKMFALSIRWGWRDTNPATGIPKNHEDKRRRYLQPDELEQLTKCLPEMDDRQAAAIIEFLLLTGARSHEVLGMRWDQVNFETGMWTKPGHETKQKTEHSVPLSQDAIAVLRGIDQTFKPKFVFPGAGKTGHRESVRKPWVKLMRDAKIEGFRVHDLRHSYASLLVSSGLSLPVIGQMLGHTQVSTTHRYAHWYDEPLRAAAEQAAAAVKGGKSAEVVPLPKRKRQHIVTNR
jgi:integrase